MATKKNIMSCECLGVKEFYLSEEIVQLVVKQIINIADGERSMLSEQAMDISKTKLLRLVSCNHSLLIGTYLHWDQSFREAS